MRRFGECRHAGKNTSEDDRRNGSNGGSANWPSGDDSNFWTSGSHNASRLIGAEYSIDTDGGNLSLFQDYRMRNINVVLFTDRTPFEAEPGYRSGALVHPSPLAAITTDETSAVA